MIEHTDKWLLVSDVDDTLTGDDLAFAELADALANNRDRVRVALNSSRPWASVERTVRDVFPDRFPIDASITAMGTQIRVGDRPCEAWDTHLGDWPRDAIFELMTSFGHRPHADEYQTLRKASFAVPRDQQADVRNALAKADLPVRIIASGTDDFDVLPTGAGKDHATRFLHESLELDAGHPLRLVVAGDSANDLAMFQAAPRAIAVGNARAELVEAMPVETTFHAKARHAAGVLEGLRHFGVLV
ncbi:MAG: HAD-IIB family hydrolase [Planctomycetota bacterium]